MRTNKIRQIYSRIPKRGVAGCLLLAAGIILTACPGGKCRRTGPVVQQAGVSRLGQSVGETLRDLSLFRGGNPAVSFGRRIPSVSWKADLASDKSRKCGFRQSKGQTPLGRRQILASWGSGFLLAAGVLYFLYVLNCGINYYRTSFSESSGITMETYSVEELTLVCRKLTEEVNERSGRVERDTDGVMRLDAEENGKVQERAVEAMQELGTVYPELSGYYPKPKPLLNAWILSVQKLSGVYSPFTVEANYNSAMTDYNIPFTACHELSHLKGFMQEQEANFIAFLAGITYDDPEFQYSSYLTGWIYCMNMPAGCRRGGMGAGAQRAFRGSGAGSFGEQQVLGQV